MLVYIELRITCIDQQGKEELSKCNNSSGIAVNVHKRHTVEDAQLKMLQHTKDYFSAQLIPSLPAHIRQHQCHS